ncbi:MAG TPA: lysophospholipid acyltransferase family protein [Anaeromyxobacteraceae bacterium]|nr:lysophospholipid acyltransferase family protein [Anaeromyxobacteraceae bacterium]
MLLAFSVVYWLFVVVTMPLFFAVALLLFLLTAAFDRRRLALHLWSCFWASCYIYANPLWKVRFEGRERLPWRGAAILVANHLSLVDILVLYGLYRPFKWVSKAEVFKVPVVGWNMVLNDYVRLKRGDRESIKAMMTHSRAHLAAGTPLLIFPEGTRSQDGRLQAFKDGAFRLAMETGVPVIPIAVRGTSDSVPKHGLVLRGRMDGRVTVLPALDPKQFESVARLRDAARAAIASATGQVDALAPPAATTTVQG